MSKILLISSNITVDPIPVYPLGMAVIASALTARGHVVEQFDFLYEEKSESRLKEVITGFHPDFTGVSIRNIDNVDSFTSDKEWYLEHTKRLVDIARDVTGNPVIIGGPAFSIMPEQILDYTSADYGVVGEGEHLLCDLIEDLEKGRSVSRIQKDEGRLKLLNGEEFLLPSFQDDLVGYYTEHSGMINYQTKRGCPHKCNYCTYPSLEGKRFRTQPPETVVDNIEQMAKRFGINTFFFTDSVFNDSGGSYLEIAEELVRRDTGIRWSGYFRPQGMARDELKLLKRSGLYAMEIGTDAGCDATLAGIGKTFTFDDVFEFNRLCIEEEIPGAHFIMFGGPGETEDTLTEALENIKKLDHCVVFAFSGIRIFPGTGLHDIAVKDGIIQAKESLLKPVYYVSPHVSQDAMNDKIIKSFKKRKDRIFPPNMGKIRMSALKMFGFRGLMWDMLVSFPEKKTGIDPAERN